MHTVSAVGSTKQAALRLTYLLTDVFLAPLPPRESGKTKTAQFGGKIALTCRGLYSRLGVSIYMDRRSCHGFFAMLHSGSIGRRRVQS